MEKSTSRGVERANGGSSIFYGGVDVEINSGNIGTIILTISFAGAVVRYFLVQPIQTALSSLKEATESLHNMLDELRNEQHNIDKRLIVVEQSAKSAHHRIDGLEAVVK